MSLQVQNCLTAKCWRLASRQKYLLPANLQLEVAIIKTLAYAGVFNYPLTESEIFKYSIFNFQSPIFNEFPISNFQISNSLRKLCNQGVVRQKNGYYFLKGYEVSVLQREKREKIFLKKFAHADNFKNWARLIPTIKLIGISGALAMQNAHEEDDIDLFIVAKGGTVWLTRFLTILLAEIMGVRRRPQDADIKDKICLNMFVDEKHLSVPEQERDLFSAHEVAQMRPIYDSRGVYRKFLRANEWVREYLPNAINSKLPPAGEAGKAQNSDVKTTLNQNKIVCCLLPVAKFLERVCRKIQLLYMQSKVTQEVIKDGYLRFHPVDARRIVLRKYEQILSKIRGEI